VQGGIIISAFIGGEVPKDPKKISAF